MPLHNVIPLCDFKYVRDISSSGTFYYDTTVEINKHEILKPTSIDRVTEIEKTKVTKLVYKDISEIEKSMIKRSLVAATKEINIEHSRAFCRDIPEIEKTGSKELNRPDIELNKAASMELTPPLREINVAAAKEFEGITPLLIDYMHGLKFLNMHELGGLNKCSNMNFEIDRIGKGDIYKGRETYLGAESPIEVSKGITWGMSKNHISDISREQHGPLLNKLQRGEIRKYDEAHYTDRVNELEIIKDHTGKLVNRVNNKDIGRDKSQRYSRVETIKNIALDDSRKLIANETVTSIDQYVGAADLERITEKLMDKHIGKRLFYRSITHEVDRIKEYKLVQQITMRDISKDYSSKVFTKLPSKNIFKINNSYVDRLHTTDIFKIQEKYADKIHSKNVFKLDSIGLNDVTITPVYRQYEKPILNLSIDDIYKEQSRSLNGPPDRVIHLPRDNKFIEVTKRWWWLNETDSRDHLIVPHRDYGGMIDLLNNDNYQYLRYDHHPIEWGKTWGIDTHIPPAAISIEVMTDLTNIILMIWHKNTQGWLNVSGKEAIQMLMELFYDWYTMDTSRPNHSYYRAYRWIRWEAEKVYFLNTKNGLQAIGILVKNLREYLKNHHFNRVPIWRNPKAMDEERNFNRVARNGDLMKPLDKNKGKRHYYIETQNFEKENKLIQAKT
ncbi:hypothetical protein NE172_02145 [Clostridium botulinum]|uniref:Uncharacterized protein n=1 Tax=Clostridium botulinum TaxID=1491 RepID=A0A6B4JHS7_CLOBO|nr:hypothetical protein [Clostridium botulinum]EES47932.1 conserved hypothetical protein [Clostridium botulinum E1 str. 'BoNT E Beluga']MBY6759746.1 hypothetical protein [Clostridium botulinum]MBY6918655.1 hypothetical protein [Clostridium botulinum]MCR1129741.1 hypothetical protein [Clostridium botulinum]NFJ56463.1 hypothetical protein [Clostridium botulinum]